MRLAVGLVLLVSSLLTGNAAAQGGATSAITGVVKDEGGGVLPGATVTATSAATGSTFEAVTSSTGSFSIPSISAGVYTVTVSLTGFKTSIIKDVRVQLGTPTSLSPVLGVGTLEETITVSGAGAELINTTTPAVTATMNVEQIAVIPTPTRNALNAVTFLVGINTPGGMRGSTINGLPESFLNLTRDGISNNDTFNKNGDGFFSPVRPRQDAVEAVTVTTAVGGAEVGGHGGATINFVTRSGTNRFTGSAYEYYRDKSLNSNYWFNERNGQPRADVRLNQFGARQGGPIVRNKAFFFGHYEEVRNPNDASRTRTVLHPRALDGWFRYNVTVGGQQTVREVNVLDLARANNQLATTDPIVMRTLQGILRSPEITGSLTPASDPLLQSYFFLNEGFQREKQPAVRVDVNLTTAHRLTGTYNHFFEGREQDHINGADRRFPGSPNYRQVRTTRPTRSLALRSTLSSNIVSELRGGITRGERLFFGRPERAAPKADNFSDTNGYALNLDQNIGLTDWHVTNTLSSRSGYQYTLDETINWLRGNHSITIGGSAFLGRAWEDSQQLTTGIDLGMDQTNDPAAPLFSAANFAGASAAQITDARELYALLTGRVIAVTGLAALDAETNRYVNLGRRRRAGKLDVFSGFIQDSWRVRPTLTVNAGVRWDVQMPFTPSNDTMTTASLADVCGISGIGKGGIYDACNFFQPRASGGKVPEFTQLTSGTRGYNIDWNNLSPNIGLAWRPGVDGGWLRALLGDPEQATFRAGYAESFERQGIGGFTGIYGPNPGSTLSLTRNASTGIVGPGETWPVLLRETNRLYAASFPESPTFPIAIRPNRADDINAFHPDIEVASARSWSVGFQRALNRDTAMEVRYLGTKGVNQWSTLNYNERNVIENGFLDEFKQAMANLQANNRAGGTRSGSFAYFGPGSGTNPLPIYLAYLNGRRDADNPAAYTGGAQTWSNATIAGRLVHTNPNPNFVSATTATSSAATNRNANAAGDLDNNLTFRNNAIAAGLPANFFVVNPHAGVVNVRDSGAFSTYHALQLELRRRLSRGLSINGSYQYALEEGSEFLGFHFGRASSPTSGSVRHAIKAQWDWQLPFGEQGRGGFLNGLVSGWQFNGAGRLQARTTGFGNVRLVGMTHAEAQKLFKFEVRPDPQTGLPTVFAFPDDVILNTRRAYSVSTTSVSGYSDLGAPEGRYFAPANSASCIQLKAGDCAPLNVLFVGPWFGRVDLGVTKRIRLGGSRSIELRADLLNALDNINFQIVDASRTPGSGAGIFQTDSAYRDLDNTYDPGGRLGQLAIRFNW
ncbi:MAG TPA: carboxypeptidase-like regulatory domain-containing protein [Vicinamibacterales bacterium]|nr:carboxypeptidase-like regulatory domain-containing protein [Vicinamibacterales bacterium]